MGDGPHLLSLHILKTLSPLSSLDPIPLKENPGCFSVLESRQSPFEGTGRLSRRHCLYRRDLLGLVCVGPDIASGLQQSLESPPRGVDGAVLAGVHEDVVQEGTECSAEEGSNHGNLKHHYH